MIVPFKLWTFLAVIGCALGTVTTLSIRAAPSASNAIIAIRVAHLELFWAKIAFRDPAVHEAEFHLDEAWSTLRDRQYEQSVFAAYEALQRVRDIKGGVPSLYSSHWESKQSEPGNPRKSKYGCSSGMKARTVKPSRIQLRGIYGRHTMALDAG
jgi:hypothetical protein